MEDKEKSFTEGVSDKVKDAFDGPDNVMGTEDDLLRRAKDKTKEIASGVVTKVKDVLDGADNIPGTADDPLVKVKASAAKSFEKVRNMFGEGEKK